MVDRVTLIFVYLLLYFALHFWFEPFQSCFGHSSYLTILFIKVLLSNFSNSQRASHHSQPSCFTTKGESKNEPDSQQIRLLNGLVSAWTRICLVNGIGPWTLGSRNFGLSRVRRKTWALKIMVFWYGKPRTCSESLMVLRLVLLLDLLGPKLVCSTRARYGCIVAVCFWGPCGVSAEKLEEEWEWWAGSWLRLIAERFAICAQPYEPHIRRLIEQHNESIRM